MNKKYSSLLVLALTACINLPVIANTPCKPIAEACMKQGYYEGGSNVGKGLIKDCVMPVAAKNKTLANTNFSDSMLKECQLRISQKMKTQMQH